MGIGRSSRQTRRCLVTAGIIIATSTLVIYLVRSGVPGMAAAPVGASWRPAGLPGQTVHSLAVGHAHRNLLFAGTQTGVYRQADGKWQRVLTSTAVWSLDLLPGDTELIAGVDDGYVYVSPDRGRSWTNRLVSRQGVYAVTVQPGNRRRIIAGAGGGIYLSRDGGREWARALKLRGSAGTAFAWLPGSDRILFAGTVPAGPGGERRVFVSRDAGATWRPFGRGMATNGGIMSLLFARNRLFAGTMGHAVWMARLNDRNWRRAGRGMPATGDHGATLIALPNGTVYVGTLGQGVFRTRDAGALWAGASAGLPRSDGLAVVLSLAATHGGRQLYAGTLSGVYRLSDPRATVTGARRE
ncbi:MAG TPA: hypothetical protein VFA78_08625 [Chloroflexota bacterium]|nr:hypothetical protein [Chloroflexota bacterium]